MTKRTLTVSFDVVVEDDPEIARIKPDEDGIRRIDGEAVFGVADLTGGDIAAYIADRLPDLLYGSDMRIVMLEAHPAAIHAEDGSNARIGLGKGEVEIRIQQRSLDRRFEVSRSGDNRTYTKSGNPWAGAYGSLAEARVEAERLQAELGGPTKAIIREFLH